jgi:hypothetical protein
MKRAMTLAPCTGGTSLTGFRRSRLAATVLGLALGLAVSPALQADGYASGRFARQNAAGGYTGGSGTAFRGPNAAGASGRRFVSDGQGNAAAASGSGVVTPYGAAGRFGQTTHSADGTTSHRGAFGATGARGSLYSQGSSSYNPATGLNANRSTSADARNSEASYQGNTSYSQGTGVVHESTCTNASGEVVSCR